MEYDWSKKGTSARDAVWLTMLDDEAWTTDQHMSATALMDLVKCYEQVSHNWLWVAAIVFQLDLQLMRLVLSIMANPRAIVINEAVSKGISIIIPTLC